jgi:hypothetical protein
MARTSYIQWNDDDARFVLDQHAEFDLYSARSLKQQSVGRHVVPFNQDTKVSFEWEISFGLIIITLFRNCIFKHQNLLLSNQVGDVMVSVFYVFF